MKKAVVTLTTGDKFNELATFTHPTFKKYSDQIGADFHVINKSIFKNSPIGYEKVQASKLFDEYQRIIYLDTDILVTPNCPNLFDIVPLGWFGAFSEGNYLNRMPAIHAGALQFGYDSERLRKFEKRYFNAGVMVFDRSHRFVFVAPSKLHNNFQDQTWLNIQLFTQNNKFVDIGPHFNRMSHLDWNERYESFIWHYAGGKFDELKEDLCRL
jgi:lipopolysaccharide biosynthesis glycosyltransferase